MFAILSARAREAGRYPLVVVNPIERPSRVEGRQLVRRLHEQVVGPLEDARYQPPAFCYLDRSEVESLN
jgi:hypothetical protein